MNERMMNELNEIAATLATRTDGFRIFDE